MREGCDPGSAGRLSLQLLTGSAYPAQRGCATWQSPCHQARRYVAWQWTQAVPRWTPRRAQSQPRRQRPPTWDRRRRSFLLLPWRRRPLLPRRRRLLPSCRRSTLWPASQRSSSSLSTAVARSSTKSPLPRQDRRRFSSPIVAPSSSLLPCLPAAPCQAALLLVRCGARHLVRHGAPAVQGPPR